MSDFINPAIYTPEVRILAQRLRLRAEEVAEPQRSRILRTLPDTVFISHTSADDAVIKGMGQRDGLPQRGSIWWLCSEVFHDPFYHSSRTGETEAYERTVGLSLLVSTRVLVIWSDKAFRSNYVKAELLIAMESHKNIAIYVLPGAPNIPLRGVTLIYSIQSLHSFLRTWRAELVKIAG